MQNGKNPNVWIRHSSANSSLEWRINLVRVHIKECLVVVKCPERGTFLLSCKQLYGGKSNMKNITSMQFMYY